MLVLVLVGRLRTTPGREREAIEESLIGAVMTPPGPSSGDALAYAVPGWSPGLGRVGADRFVSVRAASS